MTAGSTATGFRDGEYVGLSQFDATQEAAMDALKAHTKVAPLLEAGNRHHNQSLLERHLIARNWDVEQAATQLEATLNFRKARKVDELVLWPAVCPCVGYDDIDLSGRQQVAERSEWMKHGSRCYASTVYKWDKVGRPVIFERTGKCYPKPLLRKMKPEDAVMWHLHVMELQKELCAHQSKKFGYPIKTWVVIMDMTGVSMKNFNNGGYDVFRAITTVDQDFYPEALGKLVIINAPKIFTSLWNIVKPMLDPPLIAKIKILGKAYQDELLEIIAAENLPVELGGQCKERELKKPGESDEGDQVIVKLGRGESHENGAHTTAHESMTWEFWCNKDEITFSVEFWPTKGGEPIVVVAPSKEDAVSEAVCGVHSAGQEGDYFFKWDNSGNMMQRKITYVLEVVAMEVGKMENLRLDG